MKAVMTLLSSLVLFAVHASPLHAEDSFKVGSEGKGTLQGRNPADKQQPRVSTDVRIVVTKREGEKFEADMYLSRKKGHCEIKGTVDAKGVWKYTIVSIDDSGVFGKEAVGNHSGTGTLKGKVITWDYKVKGTSRSGKGKVELEE